jgi:uncharacterized protein (DUF2336 family)
MTEAPTPPNLHGLVELGNREGVDVRPTLLRVMTDLYIQKPQHTEQEEKHFTELALRLIDLVDAKTRAIVADKIAGYPPAPAKVRQRLLKELITLKEPEAANDEPGDSAAPKDELSELFFAADAEERRLILINLPYAPLPPAAAIAPAVAKEASNRLESAALGHNTELFARELERVLGISRAQARRIYEDQSGEPIVVAAVALDMPSFVLQRVLLCLHPAISQSVQRVYELALLHEEIETESALRMVAIWRAGHPANNKRPARPDAGHQPQYAPDGNGRGHRTEELPVSRPKIRWEDHAQAKSESA